MTPVVISFFFVFVTLAIIDPLKMSSKAAAPLMGRPLESVNCYVNNALHLRRKAIMP